MREAIIVPNQDILNVEVFSKKLSLKEYHSMVIKEFSDKNNLGLTFESLGIENNAFYGEYWQQGLAALGHVFLSIEDSIIIYLPDKIAMNQIKYFLDNKKYFVIKRKNLALEIVDKNRNVLLREESRAFKLLYKNIKVNLENLKDNRGIKL